MVLDIRSISCRGLGVQPPASENVLLFQRLKSTNTKSERTLRVGGLYRPMEVQLSQCMNYRLYRHHMKLVKFYQNGVRSGPNIAS